MVNNVHTLFDYVFVSDLQDRESGKTLQDWTTKGLDDRIIGGLPPSLDNIKTSRHKLTPFINSLFARLVYSM